MATVYLAHDLRHDRPVALKVLRPELAAVLGAERFLAEIKTTANLQDPHILPLFDSGQADGLVFYVIPFVEGETLRKRLEREHQLGLEETIAIARSVASALDYAHARGVIHRDIKPENILFEGDQPVVADFGIALAVQHAGSARLTETGLSLGTPGYMSPEQATGARVDGRSDIYSLACVVYELLAGEPPHRGATAQAVIAKVVTEKPAALASHRDTVPPHVDPAVAKALVKVPADRFAKATDFAAALASPGWLPLAVPAPSVVAARGVPRWVVVSGAVVVLLVGLAVGWLARGEGQAARTAFRGQVFAAPGNQLTNWPPVFSPDGQLLIFKATHRDTTRVLSRGIDGFEIEPVSGTDGIISDPAFSADSRWIAFATQRDVRKVPVGGGRPVSLGTAPLWFQNLRWGENDTIYASGVGGGLFAVPASGGEVVTLTTTDTARGEVSHHSPVILPSGRMVFNGGRST